MAFNNSLSLSASVLFSISAKSGGRGMALLAPLIPAPLAVVLSCLCIHCRRSLVEHFNICKAGKVPSFVVEIILSLVHFHLTNLRN